MLDFDTSDFYITDNAGKHFRERDIAYSTFEQYRLHSSSYPRYACCTNYAAGLKAGREAAIKASTAWTTGYAWGQLIGNRELNSATDAIRDRYVTNAGTDTYASTDGWIYGLQPYFEWLDLKHSDCTIWREAIYTGYMDYMKENDPDRFKDPTTVDTVDTSSFAYTTGYNNANYCGYFIYQYWYYNDAASADDAVSDGTKSYYFYPYVNNFIKWVETNHPECLNYIAGAKAGYEYVKSTTAYKNAYKFYTSFAAYDLTDRLSVITSGVNLASYYVDAVTDDFATNVPCNAVPTAIPYILSTIDFETSAVDATVTTLFGLYFVIGSYIIRQYNTQYSSDSVYGQYSGQVVPLTGILSSCKTTFYTMIIVQTVGVSARDNINYYLSMQLMKALCDVIANNAYLHGRYASWYLLKNGSSNYRVYNNDGTYFLSSQLQGFTSHEEYIFKLEQLYPDCTMQIQGAKDYYELYDYWRCMKSAAYTAGYTLGKTLGGGTTSALTEIYSNTATEAETISGVHNGVTVTESLTYDEVYLALEDFPDYTYFKCGMQYGYGSAASKVYYPYSRYNYFGDWAAKIE